MRASADLLVAAAAQPKRAALTLAPYVPVGGAFVTFLFWNGGIVLGDKTMHVPVLHIPQLYYFLAFTGAMLFPYILDRKTIVKTLRTFASCAK